MKAKPDDVLWTSFKNFSFGLETDRNIVRNNIITVKKKINEPNFCHSTARATNEFQDKSVLVYTINKFWNPFITRGIRRINESIHFTDVEQKMYGLSSMIQWMFRSRIRKPVREKISILIPSDRMRNLLDEWLKGEYDTKKLVAEREERKKALE